MTLSMRAGERHEDNDDHCCWWWWRKSKFPKIFPRITVHLNVIILCRYSQKQDYGDTNMCSGYTTVRKAKYFHLWIDNKSCPVHETVNVKIIIVKCTFANFENVKQIKANKCTYLYNACCDACARNYKQCTTHRLHIQNIALIRI